MRDYEGVWIDLAQCNRFGAALINIEDDLFEKRVGVIVNLCFQTSGFNGTDFKSFNLWTRW